MVEVIVLAAGSSSRMGDDKLMLVLGGEPLLRRAVRCALDARVGRVTVVLGENAAAGRRALAGLACAIVADATLPARGMNASLAAAVAALPPDAEAAAVLLADMPFVTPDMLRAVVDRRRATGARLVATRYAGRMAPPVLYDRALLGELAAGGEGDGIGRALLQRYATEVEFVDAPVEALADVDDRRDLDRARARLAGSLPP